MERNDEMGFLSKKIGLKKEAVDTIDEALINRDYLLS